MFVTDSNTLLAVMVGIFAFLFFKNIKIPYCHFINMISASTFSVLCIHAHSDAMRKWLWKDMLDNSGHYSDSLMPLYAIGCVIGIYAICTVIDTIRTNLVEKPFFKWWDKHWDNFTVWFLTKENNLFKKLNIE